VNPSNDLAASREHGVAVLSGRKENITQRRPDRVGTSAVKEGIAEKKEQPADRRMQVVARETLE